MIVGPPRCDKIIVSRLSGPAVCRRFDAAGLESPKSSKKRGNASDLALAEFYQKHFNSQSVGHILLDLGKRNIFRMVADFGLYR